MSSFYENLSVPSFFPIHTHSSSHSHTQMLRQTMEMMRNPNAMQQAMRSQDLAMSQIENLPGGFNALRRMYEEVRILIEKNVLKCSEIIFLLCLILFNHLAFTDNFHFFQFFVFSVSQASVNIEQPYCFLMYFFFFLFIY